MRNWCIVLGLALATPTAIGLIAAPARADAQKGCKTKKKKGFGSFLGGLAGSMAANSVQNRIGAPRLGGVYLHTNALNAMLVDSIACALAPDEREKAADATTRVVQRKVGATENWQSDSRPDVNGSSTVVAEVKVDGALCKDVRDVATIDGEEQTVTKRMCRAPGQSGYKMQTAAA